VFQRQASNGWKFGQSVSPRYQQALALALIYPEPGWFVLLKTVFRPIPGRHHKNNIGRIIRETIDFYNAISVFSNTAGFFSGKERVKSIGYSIIPGSLLPPKLASFGIAPQQSM
jgi:hypothetical protein